MHNQSIPGRFSPPMRPGYEATCMYILVLHTRGDYNHTSFMYNASMQLVLCHPCGHQIVQSESGFSNGHLRYSGKSIRVYYSRSQQSRVWTIYFVVSTTMNFVINDVPKDAKKNENGVCNWTLKMQDKFSIHNFHVQKWTSIVSAYWLLPLTRQKVWKSGNVIVLPELSYQFVLM